jgi:hypothetical protein
MHSIKEEGLKVFLTDSNGIHYKHVRKALPDDQKYSMRMLLSYWYFRDINLDNLLAKFFQEGNMPDVMADSGAYTAWSKGVNIDIRDYAKWIRKWENYFTAYANLDIRGDVKGTKDNQRFMEDAGLHPIPVYHADEPIEILEELVSGYSYIGIGGIAQAGLNWDAVIGRLAKCFRVADTKAVFHGFGVTNYDLLSKFRWYSADSSSWGQGFRYGNIPIFDDRIGKFKKIRIGDKKTVYSYAKIIRSYGIDPELIAEKRRLTRPQACGISALCYMRMEKYLRDRHGLVSIPNRDDINEGLKIYLAETQPTFKDIKNVIPLISNVVPNAVKRSVNKSEVSIKRDTR